MRFLLMIIVLALSLPALAQKPPKTVTIDNFVRAETDRYFRLREETGNFGALVHKRETIDVDNQDVVRSNRDTLYSVGVFDLTQPLTITLPEDDRYQSIRVMNQDHYNVMDTAKAGTYKFTQKDVGTRYIQVNVRTLVNPDDPDDVAAAHKLQDKVVVVQSDAGSLDLPNWDHASLDAVRKAILGLSGFVPDSRRMFGAKEDVDPVRHLIGTAGGWGGGPEHAALYINVYPEKNDGQTAHQLTVRDVPVDGFWSISVYNAKGFFEKNPNGGYSINNLTATTNDDGSFTINFGGDPAQPNWLHAPEGWNYTVRMYLPRQEVIDGPWTFPEAEPVK